MDTSLRLCNCYDLDSNYNHTAWFSSIEKQNSFFNKRTYYLEEDEIAYQRKNNNLKLDYDLDKLKMINYVILTNEDGTKYYYFIMDKEYVNQHSTNLILKLDVIQTYLFKIQFRDCLIEREHCQRWINSTAMPIKYIQDEGLETGEYEIKKITEVYNYGNKGSYVIASSDRLGKSNEGRVGQTTTPSSTSIFKWGNK